MMVSVDGRDRPVMLLTTCCTHLCLSLVFPDRHWAVSASANSHDAFSGCDFTSVTRSRPSALNVLPPSLDTALNASPKSTTWRLARQRAPRTT